MQFNRRGSIFNIRRRRNFEDRPIVIYNASKPQMPLMKPTFRSQKFEKFTNIIMNRHRPPYLESATPNEFRNLKQVGLGQGPKSLIGFSGALSRGHQPGGEDPLFWVYRFARCSCRPFSPPLHATLVAYDLEGASLPQLQSGAPLERVLRSPSAAPAQVVSAGFIPCTHLTRTPARNSFPSPSFTVY